VTSPGGSEQVRARISATFAVESGVLPGGRVLSRSRAINALLGVARLPAPDRRAADPDKFSDLQDAAALGRTQNDMGPLNVFERAVGPHGVEVSLPGN